MFSFLKDFIYLFMGDTHTEREREREAETQAEGETGPMQGAQCGTRSQDSRITPWVESRRQTTEPPGNPHVPIFFKRLYLFIHERHTEREREREAETQAE